MGSYRTIEVGSSNLPGVLPEALPNDADEGQRLAHGADWLRAGQPYLAAEVLRDVAAYSADLRAQLVYAVALSLTDGVKSGLVEAAARRCFDMPNGDVNAWVDVARLLIAIDRPSLALGAAERAVAADPADAEAQRLMRLLEGKKGPSAPLSFRTYHLSPTPFDPDSEPAQTPPDPRDEAAILSFVEAMLAEGRLRGAHDVLGVALEFGGSAQLLMARAITCHHLGKLLEVRDLCRGIVAIEVPDVDIMVDTARLFLTVGDPEGALLAANLAIVVDPTDDEARAVGRAAEARF